MNHAFAKIWIIIILIVVIAGGVFTWLYFGGPKEKVGTSKEVIKIENTQWGEYVLEKITKYFQSVDFMDRRLMGEGIFARLRRAEPQHQSKLGAG